MALLTIHPSLTTFYPSKLTIDTASMHHQFVNFPTAKPVTLESFESMGAMASEMGKLTSLLYEREIHVPRRHILVSSGVTRDVAWMATDSTAYHEEFAATKLEVTCTTMNPISIRTISLRGFDASDKSINRELLLRNICTAAPDELKGFGRVIAHSGLLSIAQSIYQKITPLIDTAGPGVKIVLNGHSIGGSLSVLLVLLLTKERGGK